MSVVVVLHLLLGSEAFLTVVQWADPGLEVLVNVHVRDEVGLFRELAAAYGADKPVLGLGELVLVVDGSTGFFGLLACFWQVAGVSVGVVSFKLMGSLLDCSPRIPEIKSHRSRVLKASRR